MPVVSIARTGFSSPEIKNSIRGLLDKTDLKAQNVSSILIKTNACFYWDSSTGQTTDLRVISGIIDYMRDRFGNDITIRVGEADASAMRVKHVFDVLKYDEVARQKRVELVNLSEGEKFEKEVTLAGRKILLSFSKKILESDMIINVPKMKTHPLTILTCCLKNVYGMIYESHKYRYHKYLDQAIVGANKVIRPHLNVVDGVIASARQPIKLGCLLAGTDPLAVDSISAMIMGYDPSKIPHLALARREKVGETGEITIVGEDPGKFREVFPTRNVKMEMKTVTILYSLLSAYSRVVGDIIPPSMEK